MKLTTLDQLRQTAQRAKLLCAQVAAAVAEAIEELSGFKQDKLTGTQGQVVGFDAEGNAVAQEAPSGGMTQTEADTRYLQLSGGTITGELTIKKYKKLTFLGANEPWEPDDVKLSISSTTSYKNAPDSYSDISSAIGISVPGIVLNGGFYGNFHRLQYIASPTSKNDAATKEYVDNAMPSGVIVMWSGTTVPTGWALCNGQNGTPDLRGRFVLGQSTNHAIGTTGGSEKVTLTVEQMPEHTHSYYVVVSNTSKIGTTSSRTPTTQTSETTGSAGGSQPHENMPPYYVLAYIMKL